MHFGLDSNIYQIHFIAFSFIAILLHHLFTLLKNEIILKIKSFSLTITERNYNRKRILVTLLNTIQLSFMLAFLCFRNLFLLLQLYHYS